MSDLSKIKKVLQSAAEKRKQKEMESRSSEMMETVGQDLVSALTPVLTEMAKKSTGDTEEVIREMTAALMQAVKEIKIEVPAIEIPETTIDFAPVIEAVRNIKIEVPQSQVNIPAPIVNIPETKFEIPAYPEEVGLRGIDKMKPLPVMLMDDKGKQYQFPVSMGASGGKADFFTIKGFSQSAFSEITNPDGRVKVELPTGSSGLTDTELRATAVPVSQVSGASWSVGVREIFGSTITSLLNGDNRIPVSVETGGSSLTDSELRASSVPVAQASGANWSVYVTDVFKTTVASDVLNADNRLKVSVESGSTGLTDSELRATAVPVSQVSGASWSTEVTNTVTVDGSGVTQPVSASDLDIRDLLNTSDSVSAYQVSGHRWSTEATQSGTWNIGTVTAVTNITNTVATANVDSTGVQYSGSNPMPVTMVTSSVTSTIAVGDLASDAVDTGSAPVKIGGIARQANPTAVAAGDRVSATFDDLGRQVVRPVQVRDLMRTAYATLTNGTETSLLAGVASTFHDLIYVMGANNSDVAVTVDLRASTGGSVVSTLAIPANGTVGFSLPVPMSAPFTGHTWTADMSDITGTTVYLTALFSAEV